MIIFICGAVNAGKSTVGKMLAERMKAAFVEGDDVRNIFYWQTVEEARPAIVETIASIVRTLVKRKLPMVVAYPLWNEDFEPLKKYLAGVKVPMHFVALNPTLDVAVTNRGTRELKDWEIVFIKELYAKGVNNPSFATSVDNTNLSPEECVKTIEKLLKLK